MLVLSFTDSDLACMAEAFHRAEAGSPSLRLTSLAMLKHPMSIDLYIEQVASHAKVILVRIVGGYDWWRYGPDELARLAREKSIHLIMVCGDVRPEPRLTELSTVAPSVVKSIEECLMHGGVDNAARVLAYMQSLVTGQPAETPVGVAVASGALYRAVNTHEPCGAATVLFYRAHCLAADTAPIDALLEGLAAHGIAARALMVSSLKDPAALAFLRADIAAFPPDVMIDCTAFSAGSEGFGHPLAEAGVPVLQCALANSGREAWESSARGLGTTDLAMHVVLPEADGRIFTRAISFKSEMESDASLEFTRIMHQPLADRVAYVTQLAAAWVRLAKKTEPERKLALVLSDYPGRAGRSAYAVGLDGPASAVAILQLLVSEGYDVAGFPPSGGQLLAALAHTHKLDLSSYLTWFAQLPEQSKAAIQSAWGEPEQDSFFRDGAFHLPCLRAGNVVIALQPDRGAVQDRKAGYHDAVMPPRHGYLAFYWWLREIVGIDALIHLGTHGNLEWLPGKSVALSASCWPEIVLGATPVIYPYIVSDPGEAAQAKRRIAAITLSHLTPAVTAVALSPELITLEALVDEFSSADGLDGRRMKLLREEIIFRARSAGLPGAQHVQDESALMAALETHLCDIKEQRMGDGLHIFGQSMPPESLSGMTDALCDTASAIIDKSKVMQLLEASPACESAALLAALSGRFIVPGAGGSPLRGRLDVLPTGRNLIAVDPRMIPTPTAAIIGKRGAEEFLRRYMQDNGDWPKAVVMDVWGSATLRNGGDEIAQALHLMGVTPLWDNASHRVTGFEILPAGQLTCPRVDVSLRISGLFRDMFANLITLFDDAVKAVALLSEPASVNPLAASVVGLSPDAFRQATWRIFGNAMGNYGAGISGLLDTGRWDNRDELGNAYLEASQFAYGREGQGQAEPLALKARVASADALIHNQDQRETDVLGGADFVDNEGGFAAAASMLGADPSLYHLDSSRPESIKVRTLAEEVSLTLHARALGSVWIEGQMRHGYAGAAAMADVVDQLFGFAATTDAVTPAQFDALFDAYVHNEKVRDFLSRENPQALLAMVARFQEAILRGLWKPARNSVWPLMDALTGGQGLAA